MEAGDVLGDRSGEQLDILRQVADVLAQLLGQPLVEGRAVEADLAAPGRPHADEHAGERRLAGGARADDAQTHAGLQLEGDILHGEALALGSAASCALDRQRGLRSRKLERADLGAVVLEGRAKPRPALAGGDEALPVGDGELDRSERPGDQDRGGDHDAARRLAVDDEVGADAEHAGLQRHAHHLGEGAEPARHVRGLLLMA